MEAIVVRISVVLNINIMNREIANKISFKLKQKYKKTGGWGGLKEPRKNENKICLFCNKMFTISANVNPKYHKKFCNSSCSAKYNNTKRHKTEDQKNKIRQIMMNKYCSKFCCICNAEILRLRHRKTCSNECLHKLRQQLPMPVPNKPGGYRRGSGRSKHGWYDNVYFDSTYELAYYIYCKEKGIYIERCVDKYKYINSKGKIRTYHPDFRVEGKIVEIKGYKDREVDIKLRAVNEPVELLLPKDLQHIFEFVTNHTGIKIPKLYKLYDKAMHS